MSLFFKNFPVSKIVPIFLRFLRIRRSKSRKFSRHKKIIRKIRNSCFAHFLIPENVLFFGAAFGHETKLSKRAICSKNGFSAKIFQKKITWSRWITVSEGGWAPENSKNRERKILKIEENRGNQGRTFERTSRARREKTNYFLKPFHFYRQCWNNPHHYSGCVPKSCYILLPFRDFYFFYLFEFFLPFSLFLLRFFFRFRRRCCLIVRFSGGLEKPTGKVFVVEIWE